MSWQQLVILFFLVFLPLVQGLLRRRKLEDRRSGHGDDPADPSQRESDWEVSTPTLDPGEYVPHPPRPVVVRRARVFDQPVVNRAPPDVSSRLGQRRRSNLEVPAAMVAPAMPEASRSIKATLRHPEGLRRAVLMSAILGKPRSLDTERLG